MLYTVYQIQIDRSVYNEVNRLGHEAAADQYPEYRARLATSFRGSQGYRPEYSEYYSPVCKIEAESLDAVFQIGNIGPEASITRLAQMHSISVGDIIETDSGTQYMVNSMGFKRIN